MKRSGIACGIVLITILTSVTQAKAAQIVITNTLECIDIPHQQTTDGTAVSLFGCHGSPNQRWTIANGQIVGIGGKCIDLLGASAQDHAALVIATCTSAHSQQ
jgi:alpha-glucosidase